MNGYDVAVIGGGPAGSTAGRLLAEWGYSVVLFNRLEKRKPSLAESLPPSTRKLFGFLGILQRLEERPLLPVEWQHGLVGRSGGECRTIRRVIPILGLPGTAQRF